MSPALHPEAEPPPELDDDADAGGDVASSARGKLRRLFVRGAHARGTAAPPRAVTRR
jgi:hypothetical protein